MFRRLLLVIAAPTLALLGFALVLVDQARTESRDAAAVAGVTELAAGAASLDAALGAETVAGADGYVSASRSETHGTTDVAFVALRDMAARSSTGVPSIERALDAIAETLRFRTDVDSGVISPLQLADRYARARATLHEAIAAETLRASPDRQPREAEALLALIEASRAQLDERLAVGLALRYQTWAPGQLAAVVGAIERQATHVRAAERTAPALSLAPGAELAELRQLMLSSGELPDVDRVRWDELSQAWSDTLVDAIELQSEAVALRADQAASSAARSMRLTVFAGAIVFLFAVGIAFTQSLRLARRLRRVRDAAVQIAYDPITPEPVVVADSAGDDVGALAQSFDTMAEQIRADAYNQRLQTSVLESIALGQPLAQIADTVSGLVERRGRFVAVDDGAVEFVDCDGRSIDTEHLGLSVDPELRLPLRLIDTARQRQRDRDDLERRANNDQLTGLANRANVMRILERACRSPIARRPAVLFLDLDGFKPINDAHGHDAGDAVLQRAAASLASAMPSTATVGRLGGDEFVVVIDDELAPGDVLDLGRRARSAIRAVRTPEAMQLDVSVGAAIRRSGQTHHELLAEADAAMYTAKARPTASVVLSDDQLRRIDAERRARERTLIRIAADDDLEVYYQPIWQRDADSIVALEALARPDGDVGGANTGSFFAEADRLGLAYEIDRLMLLRATRQIRSWDDRGLDVPMVAVNLTTATLNRATLVGDIFDVLHITGCSPSRLMIEVTEANLLADVAETAERLAALRERGVRIALDDFGAGYSSLAYLAALPVDVLKLDRRLVTAVDTHTTNRAIVTAVTTLAQQLGVVVVAEGVETEAEHHTLKALGVDMVQGFLLARPEPATAIERRLSRSSRRAAAAGSTPRLATP